MRAVPEEAYELILQASETSGKKRTSLALHALSISKDCADAYVILADAEQDNAEALRLLEEGVRAGERVLGKRVFRECVGDFWLVFETRPYMRARFALALLLRDIGERDRAIDIFTDLLRLNPNDNQGARYELATCFLEKGDHAALEGLLEEYENDGSAVWLYSRALLKFRQEGKSMEAEVCLREAIEENPFVPRYLLGKKDLPARHPDCMSRGERSEAIVYTLDNRRVWKETPGALGWLGAMVSSRSRKGKRR
ncbi:MAG: tetratricopeptide repeat protein [Methanoregula sp.]|uniref:tetratricopeptide repeat protein n=1 Tax=Methanoregula sp. TaxID=2052170 RepID=UPI0025D47486|nr:tetratricopeptide repeat protein [Methanoregula sp.]MCK9630739.1 tetratricopeptide repeat protein [Methanoregula sp.]